jgi:hypothetical protein
MSTDANQELIQFHQFIGQTIAGSEPLPSPEEALDLWRASHPASAEYQATVAAIQEGLDELSRGSKGMTLDEFDRDFRVRHGLPSRS